MKIFSAFLITIVSLLVWNSSIAQNSAGKISGQLTSTDKRPIDGATVLLLKAKDSSLVKTAITNASGSFGFEGVNSGQYEIAVTFIGFEKYRSQMLLLDEQHSDVVLPAITLHQVGKMLNEVSVKGHKSFIENRIDRVVVNIAGNPATAGSNALDALGIAPGVLVSPDGDIRLNGKSGATVYIDDKPTYLNGTELANYLRSLPASLLDKLEVLSNPPAKYDASGNAGIIIIRLKKNKQSGFNGSVNASYGQGIYGRTSESVNFNYRENKLNIFGSAGYSTTKKKQTSDFDYKYKNPDGSINSTLLTNSININNNKSANLRLGIDYAASKNTTFGLLLNGIISTIPNKNDIKSSILNKNFGIDSSIIANNTSKNKKQNGIINLNFDHKFDTLGTSITANLDYLRYHSTNDQTFRNDIYDPNNALANQELLLANLPANIDIYSVGTDFTHPFKHGRFDAGLKTNFSRTDNQAFYFNIIDEQSIPDYTKTNAILYKENINSAYFNYNQSFKRFEIQAGLRMENTNTNGHQLGNAVTRDSTFKRNFTNIFPTLFVSYKLDSTGINQLVFSYGRRIRRPFYQDLNPFLFFIDKFTYSAGNPYLKPSLSDNYELAYRFKDIFSFKVIRSVANDFFYKTTERTGDVFTSRPANIGRYVVSGININANVPVTKWYSINLFTEVVNDSYKGNLYQSKLDTNAYAYDVTLRHQFNFNHGWTVQLSTFYRSKRVEIQNVIDPYGFLDIGINKKLLKDKGTLSLYAKDVLRTLKLNQTITNVAQAAVSSRQIFDSRAINLSFTYNFGSNKNSNRRRNTNSIDSEKQRINDQ